jgi:hypothetical protein
MPQSAATHAGIGALSGFVEVTLCQPCVAWKNALQVRSSPCINNSKYLLIDIIINYLTDCLFPRDIFLVLIQENRPLQLHPSALYRGYGMNVASIVTVTCLQFGISRFLEQIMLDGSGGEFQNVADRL